MRAGNEGLGEAVCCHMIWATGITNDLGNQGTLEKARQIWDATHRPDHRKGEAE
jgi:hypothetical protein